MSRCLARLVPIALALALPAAAADDAWLSRVQRDLEAQEYHASQNARGLQAPNRAHRLRTYFDASGIRVLDRSAASDAAPLLALSLTGLGRDAGLAPLAPGQLVSRGERVEIQRPGLLEWYVNSSRGLEHGLTIAERPAGASALRVEFSLRGARASEAGDGSLTLATASGRKLRYGSLHVVDAAQRTIAATLSAPAPDRIRIAIEDADARYPLVVDPILSDQDPAWQYPDLFSGQSSAFFGQSIAILGHALLVGAPFYDHGETNEGAIFAFEIGLGGPGGDAVTGALWYLESNQANAHFGNSMANAGDVDGDGFDDLIVGAPEYDAGQTDEGAAFVFYSTTIFAHVFQWVDPSQADASLEANQPNARLGSSVARAGDVNGDGYADVIVGSIFYAENEAFEGSAFVYLGSASGVPSGGPESAVAQIQPNQAGAQLGVSVAAAGDVNGDGFGDVIVGAPDYERSPAFGNEGGAFVFLGNATGISGSDPASAATRLLGDQVAAHLGAHVSGGGDVNGDGFSDVLVGAPEWDAGQTNEGGAFVFLGSATGVADGTPPTADARFESNAAGAELGTLVALTGDVNGDSYADAVVLAPHDTGTSDRGLFVFLGGAAGTGDGDPSNADAYIPSTDAEPLSGGLLVGDVTEDGYADVLVGGRYTGTPALEGVFVYHGGGGGIAGGNFALPLTAEGWVLPTQTGQALGASVAGAGDVNGDGFSDLLIGSPFYDGGEVDEGAAFLFLGSATGIASGDTNSAAARLESDQAGAHLGASVAAAGDVDGDGYADVIVGADGYDGGESDEGAAFVFLGSADGIANGHAGAAHRRIESNQAGAGLGCSVAGAGDVNGDGFADVIVGAPDYDDGENDEGAAFVFAGSPIGIVGDEPADAARLQANQAGAHLGASVAGAGPLQPLTPSYGAVIVGAPGYDGGHGAAFGYFGSASGISHRDPSNADVALIASQPWAFGTSVAAAGDLNSDTNADLVVGAPGYSNGESGEGAIFVYQGPSWNLQTGSTPQRIHESNQAGAAFGTSVTGAGDVDGDGFADLIVGAPGFDGSDGEIDAGAAFVLTGGNDDSAGPGIVTLDVDAIIESGVPGNALGRSVAGAGDLNGDGFADVATGNGYTLVSYGGGDPAGRPVQLRQTRGDGSGIPIVPRGGSYDEHQFEVHMLATHPAGRARVKLEVEACEPWQNWVFVEQCPNSWSSSWVDTGASGEPVSLSLLYDDIDAPELARWRARVVYAPYSVTQPGITAPFVPKHGPWRRIGAQSVEPELRAMPEPGVGISGVAGVMTLALLARHRTRARASGA